MKNKNNKIGILIIIYFVIFLFIGMAYSFLNENLNLKGKVGFSNNSIYNFSYSYILQDSWNDGTYYYYYFVPTVTYLGNDNINSWQANIRVPYDIEITGCFEASECTVTNNILKITNASWNGILTNNSSFHFGFQMKTKTSNYELLIVAINFYKGDIVVNPPTTDKVDGFDIKFELQNSWDNTSSYNLKITNNSTVKLTSWKLEVNVNENTTIDSIWNANYVLKDNILVLSGLEWNSTIDINSNISGIGLQLKNASQLTIKSFTGITSDNKLVEINV